MASRGAQSSPENGNAPRYPPAAFSGAAAPAAAAKAALSPLAADAPPPAKACESAQNAAMYSKMDRTALLSRFTGLVEAFAAPSLPFVGMGKVGEEFVAIIADKGRGDLLDFVRDRQRDAKRQGRIKDACDRCGAEGKLKRCSRCGVARYCGPQCQRAAWKEHKDKCTPSWEAQMKI